MFEIKYRVRKGPVVTIQHSGATQKKALLKLYDQMGSRFTEVVSVRKIDLEGGSK